MRPRKRERDVAEMAAESGRRPAHVFRAFDIRAGGGGHGVAKRALGHARLDGPGDDETVRTRELGELVRHVHLPGDRLIGMPRKRGEHGGGGKRAGRSKAVRRWVASISSGKATPWFGVAPPTSRKPDSGRAFIGGLQD